MKATLQASGLVVALLAGCSGQILDGGDDDGDDDGVPFEPVTAQVYVPKVKNLMTGLAATDAEVAMVSAQPDALKALIDQWMETPEFQARMLDFFRNAFQQNQVDLNTLTTALGGTNLTQISNAYKARLQRSLMDSFPRTALAVVNEGRPFTDTLTSNRYMVTTAMLSMMSYVDERPTDDNNKTQDRLANGQVLAGFTLDPKSNATIEQSVTSMIWHDPVTIPAACTTTPPLVFTNPATGDKGSGNYRTLFNFLFGSADYAPCYPDGGAQTVPVLSDNDFTDWHMVAFNPVAATGATAPRFWDIPAMRAATTASLHVPRIGFTGTLAFAANWATNNSNEARVTANQALIVAIGQSINGESNITLFPVNATDADHAANPACAACHNQLDPLKNYLRQSFTLFYHDQQDATQIAAPAGFNISGVNTTGHGIGDLMATLASHPRFPLAWAQKLQFWANSTPAIEQDPELQRIADAFKDSGFNFKTLVRETFSSPLVTLAKPTKTTKENGVILSITRRDQYCTSLSNRLGLTDVCGMSSVTTTGAQQQLANRALLLPNDTYFRAYALPSLPTNPDLFFRQSVESMCQLIANQVIDVKTGTSKYTSTNSAAAIADFVATVMGVPPADPRSAQALQILTNHFAAASTTDGISATDALKSTFVTACIAPPAVLVGL